MRVSDYANKVLLNNVVTDIQPSTDSFAAVGTSFVCSPPVHVCFCLELPGMAKD